jgi:hypothetical protein
MNDWEITDDEVADILALGETMEVIGRLFSGDEGTVEALRMAIGALRRAADVLDGIADKNSAKA